METQRGRQVLNYFNSSIHLMFFRKKNNLTVVTGVIDKG